jgi:Holliday junction resolvase RusA-like endonuclease
MQKSSCKRTCKIKIRKGNIMIELTLPYPPTVNSYKNVGRLKTTKTGKLYQPRYNSPETNAYYCHVINSCLRSKIVSLGNVPITLEIYLYPASNHRSDISNRIKILEDALVKAGCFDDDSQVDFLMVKRMPVFQYGKVEVKIYPSNPASVKETP